MISVIERLAKWLRSIPWIANSRLGKFIIEVLVEMPAVTWPTKEDVISSTVVVLVTLVVVAFFLYVVNIGVGWGVERFGNLLGSFGA